MVLLKERVSRGSKQIGTWPGVDLKIFLVPFDGIYGMELDFCVSCVLML